MNKLANKWVPVEVCTSCKHCHKLQGYFRTYECLVNRSAVNWNQDILVIKKDMVRTTTYCDNPEVKTYLLLIGEENAPTIGELLKQTFTG